MLTFEDFFSKKKIDLLKLQVAEPALFADFSKHYLLMGEKSFDHTKKYWFNQLRRTYPLLTEVKPHAVQPEAITATVVQAVTVAAAQNIDAELERPKFKEDNLPDLVDENVDKQEVSLTQEEKLITDAEIVTEKPAFKPRFNPKNIPKSTVENQIETEDKEIKTEPAKPAFKPRFNMQNTKKEVVKTASDTDVPLQEIVSESDAKTEVAKSDSDQIVVKPVFKPRFNPKNIPKQVTENEIVAENNEVAPQSNQPSENLSIKTVSENEQTNTDSSFDPATEQAEKPVYKPRFQMKNIKKTQSGLD